MKAFHRGPAKKIKVENDSVLLLNTHLNLSAHEGGVPQLSCVFSFDTVF